MEKTMFPWYATLLWRHFESNSGGGEGGEGGGEGDGGEGQTPKTYTKAEVDAMTAKAVARATKPFGDYADLKAKADKLVEIETASQTNEQRLQQQRDQAVRDRDQALQRATDATVRAAVVAEASKQGAIAPDDVAALVDRADLELTDTGVDGVEEAVRALLASKPYLAGKTGARRAGVDLTNQNNQSPPTTVTRSQHREWIRTGTLTRERAKLVEEAIRDGRYQSDR